MRNGGWPAIVLVYGIGVLAAAQLGKFAALIPLVRADLGIGLTSAAWLASLIEAGGATMGIFAGFVVRRFGTSTMLSVGLGVLALAGIGQVLAWNVPVLFAWRLAESLGYLAIVVAAPTLIARLAGPQRLTAAMSLWSSFFPIGLALGTVLGGLATLVLPWRMIVLAGAAVAAGALLFALRIRPGLTEPPAPGRARPNGATWAMACGFGAYTTFCVGFLALLPSYLVEQQGFDPSLAGVVGGAASVVAIAGSAYAVVGLRRGRLRLTVSALVVPAALLFVAWGDVGPWLVAGASILLSAISGIIPAVAFARMPVLAGPGGVAVANGLFAQFGASGSMIGPPLLAACGSHWGWTVAATVGAVASAVSLALMLLAEHRHAAHG